MRHTGKRFQKSGAPSAIAILKSVDRYQMLALALANVPAIITVFIAAQRH
jgi:hypothetical protein